MKKRNRHKRFNVCRTISAITAGAGILIAASIPEQADILQYIGQMISGLAVFTAGFAAYKAFRYAEIMINERERRKKWNEAMQDIYNR